MKKKPAVRLLALSALTTGVILLSACSGSNHQASNNSNTTPSNTVSPPANGNGQAGQDSSGSGNTAGGGNSGNAGNSANSGNSGNSGTSGTSGNASAGNAGSGSSGNASEPTSSASQTVKAMLALAKDGKVKGIPYAAHTGLIDDVEKLWGKADKTEAAGKGLYATYAKKHAVIGFNKGSQIFDVRSDAPEVQKLTLKQIEAALGKAKKITKNGSDTIYAYEAGKSFELRFVIAKDTGKTDHISVYAPADAVNNMAG